MPARSDVTYFGAGPALLPTPVLEHAAEALVNYDSTGLGLAEHSHRSSLATGILEKTKKDLKALIDIPDDYEVMFMQGGGSGQFSAVMYNLISVWVERRRRRLQSTLFENSPDATIEDLHSAVIEGLKKEVEHELKLDYIVTGSWSLKASQEAARHLDSKHINIAMDARSDTDGRFTTIPKQDQWKLTPTRREGGTGPAFVYYCDNETVDGVEFPAFPEILEADSEVEEDDRLVVADMSSNILSRRVDVRKFGVIFAGAQKNIGTTGLTIVIIRKSLLPPKTTPVSTALLRKLGLPIGPTILDYATVAKNNSLYNTLSIFDVWVAGQVVAGLLTRFPEEKVSGMQAVANKKAALIYAVLDKYPEVYTVVPLKDVRSRMNICFRVGDGDEDVEKKWLAGAEQRGLLGLKGHRSVGGIRCSNYNSISVEGAEKLARYLDEYATQK